MRTRAASRIVLLPAPPRPAASTAADRVRRYRLARVRVAERNAAAPPAQPQLGRSYD